MTAPRGVVRTIRGPGIDIVPPECFRSSSFAAFWVVLAFGLFFVAARGGLGGARAALQTQSREGRKGITAVLVVIYVGFGIAIPIMILAGNHANAAQQVGGVKLTSADRTGRELFGEHCGVCHTLAAANASARSVPTWTRSSHRSRSCSTPSPTAVSRTRRRRTAGELPRPGCDAVPALPAETRENVASFVAKVAGKE